MLKRGRGSKEIKKPVVNIKITTRMPEQNKAEGLYTSDREDSFESVQDIGRKNFYKARVQIEEGSMPTNLTFEDFHEEALRRAEFREKVEGEKRHIEINIDTDKPVAIAFLSDLHLGNGGIDYELLKQTGEIIKEHPLAYCITGGDITDSLFFDYGEEILNMQEQYVYMHKLLSWVGPDNILAGILGNHEAWSRKSGITNQQNRANRELQGADVVMAAHTHKPGESFIYQPEYGGGARKVALVNGKTFKKLDAYGKDQGYIPVAGEQLGCNWIILNNDKKMVRIASSNEEMIETMQFYV